MARNNNVIKINNMKTISPVQSWTNGQSVEATIFNMYPIGGTLGESASFYYALLDDSLVQVSQGNLTMDGQAYQDWGNDDEYAWEWAATTLNLTITGDYVPVTEEAE
jgi:hypothetical protein